MTIEKSNSLLPFLEGADLSHNDFQGDKFPSAIAQMKRLRWLKLARTKLDYLPEELKQLEKLEKLNLSHNKLVSLIGEVIFLDNLKYLDCRYNNIHNSDIPPELFTLKSLEIIDFSHNNLTDVPKNIESCPALTTLNLSNNKIDNIKENTFLDLNRLQSLNLSYNKLNSLPTSLGRLINLKVLNISGNPFNEIKLRLVEKLKSLETLSMRNTSRENQNMPNLSSLTNLVELDLSCNKLTRVPDDITWCSKLKRLNISENRLEKLPERFGDSFLSLESLNISDNKLNELPNSLCKMCNLKRLYINDNMLNFEGIPPAIGKLRQLEILMAARNNLELIPESIIRCISLKKLILTSNKLITLPDSIHLLNDIEVLELSNNPDLIMPAKPFSETSKNLEFYNIDFSLNTQLLLAGDPSVAKNMPQPSPTKDHIARKIRLRKRNKDDVEQEKKQAKVLKGMQDLVLEKENMNQNIDLALEHDLKPKRWDEVLEKPAIDYSDFFDEITGSNQGILVWEIENFCPVLTTVDTHGSFYEADCYIILDSRYDETRCFQYRIYYWIGSQAALDKKACAAIHAVNLRNHLSAQCRTIREEQGDESAEFKALFGDNFKYVEGGRTASGFYTVEEPKYSSRMYRLHEVADKTRELHLESVELSSNSLDSRFVFVIDTGYRIYIWNGLKAKNTTKQKARLLGDKLNIEERKNKAELVFCDQGDETSSLLAELNLSDTLPKVPFKTIDLSNDFEVENYQPRRPILYQICLGKGSLELSQIDFPDGKLMSKHLVSNKVFILDCLTDVFVWCGRKSSKMEKKAALRMAEELFSMVKRQEFASLISLSQGTEPLLFKNKFKEWDDVIAVDYTRTAESVSRTGADIEKWMKQQKVKIDLSALFVDRQVPISDEDANLIIEELNDELEAMNAFILEKGKTFAKLPRHEFGHFYSDDCYVFLCRYLVQEELNDSSNDEEDGKLPNGLPIQNGNENQDASSNHPEINYVVYFWQGRNASKMGWLTFTFSLQKKFESLFGNKLEVVQMHQQQEDKFKFFAHFNRKFIIHRGRRLSSTRKEIEFYHLRSNSNPLTLRCIEIEPDSASLNSGFCYILKLNNPNANSDTTSNGHDVMEDDYDDCSQIYVWIGSKSKSCEAQIAFEIANEKLHQPGENFVVHRLDEGDEPDEFWSALGGRKSYETNADFMLHTRLFRCSNEMGYFAISEKCSDFCQDDLSDDDIMILDNGSQTFLWIGPKSSEVEVKLAYKSAQVYVQNLRIKESDRPRQLMLTIKGKESKKFTKCFHAWSQYKTIKDPRDT